MTSRHLTPLRLFILLALLGSRCLPAQEAWTPVASPVAQNLLAVTYSATPGLFVAVGEFGTILTSSDGQTWTPRTSGTIERLYGVVYGKRQFVAVGQHGTVLRSADGIAWAVGDTGNAAFVNSRVQTRPRLNGIAYGNGLYVAISDDGPVVKSPDAVNWTLGQTISGAHGLVFARGTFLATGFNGSFATSPTASDFTRGNLRDNSYLESVAYGRNQFIVVGSEGLVFTSPDARRWTSLPAPTASRLRGVTFFNGRYIAVGEEATILTSPDAHTWMQRSNSGSLHTAVAASPDIAVIVGYEGKIFRSAAPSAITLDQPTQTVTATSGDSVPLSVNASGPGPLAYQWSLNQQSIPGATDATFVLKNVQSAGAGTYKVTVSSPGRPAAAVTGEVKLTVLPVPTPTSFIDSAFNVTPALTSEPLTAIEQPDLKIILGGSFLTLVNGIGQSGLARYNLDGSLDSTFQVGTGLSGGQAEVTTLALQSDGKVLVGGDFTSVSGTSRPNLARLQPNGALDLSFTPPPSLGARPTTQVVVQPDGKILVVNDGRQLLRLTADGSADSTFVSPPPDSLSVLRIALTSAGQIVAAQGVSGTRITVRKYQADGTADSTFTPINLLQPGLVDLRVVDDGGVIAITQYGVSIANWAIERFTATGARDPSFTALEGALNRNTGTYGIAGDGRITYQISRSSSGLGERFTTLRRLNRDGSVDATLRPIADAATAPVNGLNKIIPLSGGRTLLLGSFTSVDGLARARVARTVGANAPAAAPPGIATASPQEVTVSAGDPVTLFLVPTGTGPFTTKWSADSATPATVSGDGTAYTITNAQQTGFYSATVSNAGGTFPSPVFYVIVTPSAPRVVAPATSLSVNSGRTAVFTADTRGSAPLTYQWFFNGAPVGDNSPTLTVPDVSARQAGTYTLVVRNSLGTVTASEARLTVDDTSRLANLATRGLVGTGQNVLTAGFVLTGPVPRTILIRGIGPGLAQFGLTDLLADPQLTLFDAAGAKLASNDNWTASDSGASTALFQKWGAFALSGGSADAALVRTLPPGAYTVQVSGANGGTGLALAEIYEADLLPTRLINLSSRLVVGTGAALAIPGITVSGSVARKLLIRAIGPGLTAFGTTGNLADPSLVITKTDGTVVASNDDWSAAAAPEAKAAATAVGAFPLPETAKDAALLVTLPPGSYTAHIRGANGTSGLALIEVYEVP